MKQTKENRRIFIIQSIAMASVLSSNSYAQNNQVDSISKKEPGNKLKTKDSEALIFSYEEDTRQVQASKFKNYARTQNCSSCGLYSGKPKDLFGTCPVFPNKSVSANGWCMAWTDIQSLK